MTKFKRCAPAAAPSHFSPLLTTFRDPRLLMFAKKPALEPAAAAPARRPAAVLAGAVANPWIGAGGAGLLFLLSAAALVLVLADPHAGAPHVRIPLQALSGHAPEGGLRPSLDGFAGATLDTLAPGQDIPMAGLPETATRIEPAHGAPAGTPGEVVITLPQGGSLGGASAPPPRAASPLPTAPIAGLSQPGPGGPLPVIGPGGKTPFQAYARPFVSNGRPRIAIVVGGLGLNPASTRAAIDRLPAEVTLSFVPYADGLQGFIDLARAQGHEVMLEIPMEPTDYPDNDPGPSTLMAAARPEETTKRLEWLLARATGYFAVTNYLGGKFLGSSGGMGAFLASMKARGLGFLDDGQARRIGGGVPRASADAVIDDQLSASAIDRQLLGLEAAALQKGASLGAGFAYPVTVEAIARWANALPGRGYQLAPASAVAKVR
jgi:polysaccharide deacetylase 2 family uncharacterized protein YibQ